MSIEDVTARVQNAVTGALAHAQPLDANDAAAKARRAVIADIEKESKGFRRHVPQFPLQRIIIPLR